MATADAPTPRAIYIERCPVDLRRQLDEEAARTGFNLRTTVILLLQEALEARRTKGDR